MRAVRHFVIVQSSSTGKQIYVKPDIHRFIGKTQIESMTNSHCDGNNDQGNPVSAQRMIDRRLSSDQKIYHKDIDDRCTPLEVDPS